MGHDSASLRVQRAIQGVERKRRRVQCSSFYQKVKSVFSTFLWHHASAV